MTCLTTDLNAYHNQPPQAFKANGACNTGASTATATGATAIEETKPTQAIL